MQTVGARTEDLQRCPDLWFDDGNLVLQAEQTLFQVYKGILCRESPVFADMLSLGPGQSEEHYEQVPLVRMPDSAEEMTLFLSVIFNHQFMDNLRRSLKLTTILDIATKYQASRVRNRAIAMLSLEFPSALTEYDALRSQLSHQKACQTESDFWALTAATTTAARRSNARILLPAAYLQAASRSVQDILAQDALDPIDRNVILISRDKLSLMARRRTHPTVFSHTCGYSTSTCFSEWHRVQQTAEVVDNFFDPFLILSVRGGKICPASQTDYDKDRQKRDAAWTELPAVYGLPSWEELAKNDA